MSLATIDSRTDYELVIAGQTTQTIGAVGAKGNILQRVIIIPTSVSPGVVAIKDGAATAFNIFDGGANSLLELKPIVVELGAKSVSGAWQITTGANVRALAIGRFADGVNG